jgi:hypothetical protein
MALNEQHRAAKGKQNFVIAAAYRSNEVGLNSFGSAIARRTRSLPKSYPQISTTVSLFSTTPQ